MDSLGLTHDLKGGLVGPPKIYLGAEIKNYQVRSGKSHPSTPITQYVKNTTKTVEVPLNNDYRKLRMVNSAGK